MIDRNKFKTELGKKLYDILKPIAPHPDWLELMIMRSRGDDRRKQVLDYIEQNNPKWNEIDDFIMENWG